MDISRTLYVFFIGEFSIFYSSEASLDFRQDHNTVSVVSVSVRPSQICPDLLNICAGLYNINQQHIVILKSISLFDCILSDLHMSFFKRKSKELHIKEKK